MIISQGVKTESRKVKISKSMREATENKNSNWATVVYTSRQSSAKQHRFASDEGTRDDNSIPGRHWVSYVGGGASNVDAPGSSMKLYRERNSDIVLEVIILAFLQAMFALPRTTGHKYPRTSGLVLRFACGLLTGTLCCCVGVLTIGWVPCTTVLMSSNGVPTLTSRTRRIVAVRVFICFPSFRRQLLQLRCVIYRSFSRNL